MKFDLHCHSDASDGKLEPTQVLALAEAADLDLFALTDHDTLAGYTALQGQPTSLALISGIELSTLWSGVCIHIIGLDFDAGHPQMIQLVDSQREVRKQRALVIDQRLAAKQMPDLLQGALAHCADIEQLGRPHFARAMVERGFVKNERQAFDRWLGQGKLGDVKSGWPGIATAIETIRVAGGVAVLAHPYRYKMTFTKLRRLIGEFAELGGDAVEVVGQQLDRDRLQRLLELLSSHQLAASGGSDFHDPDWAWSKIGAVDALPEQVTPVWQRFKRSKIA